MRRYLDDVRTSLGNNDRRIKTFADDIKELIRLAKEADLLQPDSTNEPEARKAGH